MELNPKSAEIAFSGVSFWGLDNRRMASSIRKLFNFAGIGTTGGGVPGNSYPDVRTGVRAQIQHLKAYATDEPLKWLRWKTGRK